MYQALYSRTSRLSSPVVAREEILADCVTD